MTIHSIYVMLANGKSCLGPGYLKDHFSPVISTQPTRVGRQCNLHVPSSINGFLVGARKWAFSGGFHSLEYHSARDKVGPHLVTLLSCYFPV